MKTFNILNTIALVMLIALTIVFVINQIFSQDDSRRTVRETYCFWGIFFV
jgi:hypothetical protein